MTAAGVWANQMPMSSFQTKILEEMVADLKSDPLVLAVWEGGSAANGTSDEYSDIDLIVVGSKSIDTIFESIESTLNRVSTITHRRVEPTQFLPDYFQRVYFLEDAPKHFFVDAGVFLRESEHLFLELLQIERHGSPVVHFDKLDLVKPRNGDLSELKAKQRKRLSEIEDAFPIFKTEVLKELDRGHSVDAFAFYFDGIVRPLVELMGMLHRPFRYDFGLRYLHKSFPENDRKQIEDLLYVCTVDEMKDRVLKADRLFHETRLLVQKHLSS